MTTHPPETGSPALRVGELHQRLGSAIREAGIGEAWVQGTVSGFRPGARFTSWELVEYQADATTVAAVIQAGAFPREMTAITQVRGLSSSGAGLNGKPPPLRAMMVGAGLRT